MFYCSRLDRASKAAQNQFAKTLSLEWQRTHKNTAVVQLHPGTVATDLSSPFQVQTKSEASVCHLSCPTSAQPFSAVAEFFKTVSCVDPSFFVEKREGE